ncbi:hypothetical protein P691DRAFT_131951 [Macrolepiota fuliginosa MF-IS2]|uniref:F-box domain-containing protein n=1 Tax=Macrolepiota fuliginosa MF-IS2 TaxID=1400762 RepID=A0A9P5XK67_9AGAR|nr:hypothetical protein P691DRAFT_131951 [Macrolepiota fuliginosa MF-IS2]
MSLDFSFFADDMVLEILGHLPALDIVRYRKVCRRIYQASKERSVWIDAFLRAQCPLPSLDLETTPTQDIERLLVRMEIMDAKWSGIRPRFPQMDKKPSLKGSSLTPPIYDLMLPFLVETKRDGRGITYAWYRRGDLQNPTLEYQISTNFLPLMTHLHSYIDIVRSALYIVYPQIVPESPDSEARHHLKIIKFECSKENAVTKTLEHEIPMQDPGSDERMCELSVNNGYATLFRYATNHRVIELFHLETGRTTTYPVHVRPTLLYATIPILNRLYPS